MKNNDIINVIQPTNINRNLIILNLPKTQNDLANLKSYFQNSSENKENVLNITDTQQIIKEKKRNSSVSPCLSRLSDESIIIKIDKMKEKLIYNSIINLKQIKQTNFQINASYKNINILSHDKYIKDVNLQSKITTILKSEIENHIEEKTTFLNYPKTTININKKATFNASLINNINNTEHENITHKSSSKLLSVNVELNHNLKIKRIQTKKKSNKISRQLNIITKNIENTSNNINNPAQFYSKFFKNIIDKKA